MAFLLPIIGEGALLLLEGETVSTIGAAAAGSIAGNVLTPILTDAAAGLLTEEIVGAGVGAVINTVVDTSVLTETGLGAATIGTIAETATGDLIGGVVGGASSLSEIDATITGAALTNPTNLVEGSLLETTLGEVSGETAANLVIDTTVISAETGYIVSMLESLGITEERLGKITYDLVISSIAAGAISELDLKQAVEQNSQLLFNNIIDHIAGDQDIFTDYSKLIIIGSNGEVIQASDIPQMKNAKYFDAFRVGYDTGMALTSQAYNVFLFEKDNVPRDKAYLLAAIKSATEDIPRAYMGKKLLEYVQSTDYINDPNKYSGVIEQFKAVYNGDIDPENVWLDDNKSLHVIDETGVERIFNYSEDNYLNLFGQKFSMPQLHGNYVGPGSVGGASPVDELDLYAALHDISYDDNGYFSKIGDIQLLSRIQSYLDKHPIQSEINESFYDKLLFTKFYFTYIGPLASIIANNNNDDEINNYLSGKQGDFYEFILRQTLDKDPYEGYREFGFKNPARKYYLLLQDEMRMNFYAGLKQGIDQNTELIYYDFMNDKQLEQIDNMQIIT